MNHNNTPSSNYDPASQSFERNERELLSAEQANGIMSATIRRVYGDDPTPSINARFILTIDDDSKVNIMPCRSTTGAYDSKGVLQRTAKDQAPQGGYALGTPLADMESSDGTKRSVRLISSTFGRVGEDGQLSDSYTTLLIVDKTTAPTGEVTLTSTPTVLFSSAMNVRGQKVTPLSQRICQEFSSEDLTDFLVSMADDTAGPEMRARFLQVLDTLPVDTEVHGVSIPVVFSPSTPVFHN